jgi:hypothetical protein
VYTSAKSTSPIWELNSTKRFFLSGSIGPPIGTLGGLRQDTFKSQSTEVLQHAYASDGNEGVNLRVPWGQRPNPINPNLKSNSKYWAELAQMRQIFGKLQINGRSARHSIQVTMHILRTPRPTSSLCTAIIVVEVRLGRPALLHLLVELQVPGWLLVVSIGSLNGTIFCVR